MPRWEQFAFSASVVVNIAFLVVFIAIIGTHALDVTLIKEGVNRYCDTSNDAKFADSSAKVRALRDFTCARGDAADDFQTAFNAYLKSKGID